MNTTKVGQCESSLCSLTQFLFLFHNVLHICLNVCISSYLCAAYFGILVSLCYCTQSTGLLHSLWAEAFPPDFNLPKQKGGGRKPAGLHTIHTKTQAHAQISAGIFLANTQGRKRILVFETCLVRCISIQVSKTETIGRFKSNEILKIHRKIKRISRGPVFTQIKFNTVCPICSNFKK